jgi:NADH-ubiquinone oxidoreductase chain 1
LIYYFSPVFGFFLSLLVWVLIPYLSGFISFELVFPLPPCTRLGVYTVMIAGWSANSGYSLLGGLRALAQTISYEVRLAFILLSFVVLVCRYDLTYFYFFQVYL